jgi:MFS superfamily sulfate permease-like transporter
MLSSGNVALQLINDIGDLSNLESGISNHIWHLSSCDTKAQHHSLSYAYIHVYTLMILTYYFTVINELIVSLCIVCVSLVWHVSYMCQRHLKSEVDVSTLTIQEFWN